MNKVASIELLRFISAFMVLVWHYQQFYLPYNPFSNFEIILSSRSIQPFYKFLNIFYNFGNKGVDFFFIISGFVFAHVYLSKYNNASFKTFFVNRFARLYPLHLLTLFIVGNVIYLVDLQKIYIYKTWEVFREVKNFFNYL